jgi:hypothetical protein
VRADGAIGIVLGQGPNAARSDATVQATRADFAVWATEQARLWTAAGLKTPEAIRLAGMVAAAGGDVGELPICFGSEGPLGWSDLVAWAAERDEVLFWEDIDIDDVPRGPGRDLEFHPGPDTIVIDDYTPRDSVLALAPDDPARPSPAIRLSTLVYAAIAHAWGKDPDDLEAGASYTYDRLVGSNDVDDVYTSSAFELRRHSDE